jgi:hypothetical protein
MTSEAKVERRWQWMLNHEDADVRLMAIRLSREPVLRSLFPFTTDRTLFRFSTVSEWPYTDMPYLEINREHECFLVCGAGVDGVIATGTLEDMVPVLVRAVTTHLLRDGGGNG